MRAIMGKIIQKAMLENSYDLGAEKEGALGKEKIRNLEVDFLVDTGAAMLCMPISMIDKLGLYHTHSRDVVTANGRIKRRVFSPVRISVMDREGFAEVMELPEDTPPLMGYLILENLDLYPNPNKQILEGNPKYDGKMVMDLL